MRFELPGLTSGPTDRDLEHLERHQLTVRPPSAALNEEAQAAALGLSVAQWRTLQGCLAQLRRR